MTSITDSFTEIFNEHYQKLQEWPGMDFGLTFFPQDTLESLPKPTFLMDPETSVTLMDQQSDEIYRQILSFEILTPVSKKKRQRTIEKEMSLAQKFLFLLTEAHPTKNVYSKLLSAIRYIKSRTQDFVTKITPEQFRHYLREGPYNRKTQFKNGPLVYGKLEDLGFSEEIIDFAVHFCVEIKIEAMAVIFEHGISEKHYPNPEIIQDYSSKRNAGENRKKPAQYFNDKVQQQFSPLFDLVFENCFLDFFTETQRANIDKNMVKESLKGTFN